MALNIFALVALVAVVKCAVLPAAPLVAAVQTPAHYKFGYHVNDPITGDNKHHEETRVGDAVRGSYSLVEPDGTLRVVEYFDDGVSGFKAIVQKEPAFTQRIAHVAPAVRAAFHVAAPSVHTAALRRSGLYSPYNTAYSNPWYSPYVSPYLF